jgi:hypothetical protein
MLSLGWIFCQRIGSFTVDNGGFISLSNRPLTLRLQYLENEGVPTDIDRRLTYSVAEPYLFDLLAYHDSRIRHQPNSINDRLDGQRQMAALAIMRSIVHHFVDRDLRHGPFPLTLTDLHPSNIFVDADWHVKYVVDLEWTCSLPVEMQHPPYWLSGYDLDDLTGQHLVDFNQIGEEFKEEFEREEKLQGPSIRTHILNRAWKVGNF